MAEVRTEKDSEIVSAENIDEYERKDGNDIHKTEGIEPPKISKRQLKRLKRKERWEEIKHLKRAQERAKKKARKRAALERGEDLGPSRKTLKHNKMHMSNCKMRVVLDCSFDNLMIEKDVCRLIKQVQHIYAINRRAENPLQFYLTSMGDKTQEKLDSFGDYKNWDINYDTREYINIFDKSDIVYLTSESPNTLTELDQSKVYIIGGLVDHNFHKGLCHDLAVKKEVSHAKLPISEYIQMKTRKVLTVDQVFEILLRFTEVNSWEKALLSVIPIRKGATSKAAKEGEKDASSTDKECGSTSDDSDNDSCDKTIKHEVLADSNHTEDASNNDACISKNCEIKLLDAKNIKTEKS